VLKFLLLISLLDDLDTWVGTEPTKALNSGLCTCKTGTLLLESHLQSVSLLGFEVHGRELTTLTHSLILLTLILIKLLSA
jgi:hypothetical protein